MPEPRAFPVLFVDDDRNLRRVFSLALRDDFDLHVAAGGAEALEIAARVPPAVLVTDQRMPEMSGLELAQRVRQLYPAAERLLLTACPASPEFREALRSGLVAQVLEKPFRVDQLAELLRALIARRGDGP